MHVQLMLIHYICRYGKSTAKFTEDILTETWEEWRCKGFRRGNQSKRDQRELFLISLVRRRRRMWWIEGLCVACSAVINYIFYQHQTFFMIPPGIQLCLKNKTFQVSRRPPTVLYTLTHTPLVKGTRRVRLRWCHKTHYDDVVAGDIFIYLPRTTQGRLKFCVFFLWTKMRPIAVLIYSVSFYIIIANTEMLLFLLLLFNI